jgi:hypothetical protein
MKLHFAPDGRVIRDHSPRTGRHACRLALALTEQADIRLMLL